MSPDTGALFQPFHLKSLTLKNRIVMAPMTRSFSPEGVPGADVAAYYTATRMKSWIWFVRGPVA